MIGPFRPFAELQRGRGGVVFRALDVRAGDVVLLKVLTPTGSGVPEPPREAILLAGIDHPNLVPVREAGVADGRPYVAFAFLEGGDLEGLLVDGPLPVGMALHVLGECARALAAAHAHGVLHRDVKPSNILVPDAGGIRLTDFGLATPCDDGTGVRGTPGYLAPEVVRGAGHTPASDVFALGVCFVEMLTGRRAYGPTPGVDATLLPPALPPGAAPPAVEALARHLAARDPADRPATGAEVLDALGALAGAGPHAPASPEAWARFRAAPNAYVPEAPPPADPAPPPRPARPAPPVPGRRTSRRRRLAARVALVGALLLGVAAGGRWLAPDPPDVSSLASATPADTLLPIPDAARAAAGTDAPEAAPRTPTPDVRGAAGADVPDDAGPAGPTGGGVDPTAASRAAAALVEVRVRPWASVWIEGDSVGTTPLADVLRLPPGAHVLELRHPDFPLRRHELRVGSGEQAVVDVSLWDGVGRVFVDVAPWAHVEIDGRRVGTTPLTRPLLLAPGHYALRLVHPALGSWTVPLVVRAGEEQRLELDFPSRDIREGT